MFKSMSSIAIQIFRKVKTRLFDPVFILIAYIYLIAVSVFLLNLFPLNSDCQNQNIHFNQIAATVKPFNTRYSKLNFLKTADSDCSQPIGLLIIVKSAPTNSEKRNAIRLTWGDKIYLNRTSFSPKLPSKVAFIIGLPFDDTRSHIEKESEMHDDVILVDYVDTYRNLTYKTMSALRWTLEICNQFRYLMLVDDDIFLSIKNVVNYLTSPFEFERKALAIKSGQDPIEVTRMVDTNMKKQYKRQKRPKFVKNKEEFELHTGKVYLGYAVWGGSPYRDILSVRFKKWFVSQAVYPKNYYPDYIIGLAIVMSKTTVQDFVHHSAHTPHLPVDDVYLGILADKANIKAVHSDYFTLETSDWHKNIKSVDYTLVCRGFVPAQLIEVWTYFKTTIKNFDTL